MAVAAIKSWIKKSVRVECLNDQTYSGELVDDGEYGWLVLRNDRDELTAILRSSIVTVRLEESAP